MKEIFKATLLFILSLTLLWLTFVLIDILVIFSYSDHSLSWIPYSLLGGWIPGKMYGLNLIHSIICVISSIGIIGLLDKIIKLKSRIRTIILFLVALLFLYEAIFNFCFQNVEDELFIHYKQIAILQFSIFIGILFKALSFKEKLE